MQNLDELFGISILELEFLYLISDLIRGRIIITQGFIIYLDRVFLSHFISCSVITLFSGISFCEEQ